MSNDNSGELLATGFILIIFSLIFLVTPVVLPTISGITGIKLETLTLITITGFIIGIAFTVVGFRSRKNAG